MEEQIPQKAEEEKKKRWLTQRRGPPQRREPLGSKLPSPGLWKVQNSPQYWGRKPKPLAVRGCVSSLYQKLSAHAHKVDQPVIIIKSNNLTPDKWVDLSCFSNSRISSPSHYPGGRGTWRSSRRRGREDGGIFGVWTRIGINKNCLLLALSQRGFLAGGKKIKKIMGAY